MYPDSFIQQLKDKSDIVSVISDYVQLQRRGRDYWACCPFHNEKTPSFQVKSDHQYYRCYGCGKMGDVINFVMEMEKLPFNEAVEKLADKCGLQLPENAYDKEYEQRKKTLGKIYAVNREAALFYYENLKLAEGSEALAYCLNRGLTRETIVRFGMGCSTDYDSVVKHLKSKGYDVESMKTAGVIGVTDDGKPYDFFAKRLTIPIISVDGKVIGFTGRTLEKKPDHAKYKNTTTTLAFNKRKNLFGANMYRQYVPAGNRAIILVEGHMDVISMFQAGICNVVASMGTSLTPEQCREIKRYADVVYVSYDGDSAGQEATLRGLSLLKAEGLEVKVVQLNGGLDPDDYVRKYGKDGYLKLVDEALPLVDFKLKKTEEKYKFDSYDDRVKYVKETVEVLNTLDNVEKAVYIEKVSKKSGLSQDRIEDFISSSDQSVARKDSPIIENADKDTENKTAKKEENAFTIAERFVLASMVFGKEYAKYGDADDRIFVSEPHKKIFGYIMECAESAKPPMASRVFDLTDEADSDAIIGALDGVKIENQETFYIQCLKKLRKQYSDCELKKTIEELEKETDRNKIAELKKKALSLTRINKEE